MAFERGSLTVLERDKGLPWETVILGENNKREFPVVIPKRKKMKKKN